MPARHPPEIEDEQLGDPLVAERPALDPLVDVEGGDIRSFYRTGRLILTSAVR